VDRRKFLKSLAGGIAGTGMTGFGGLFYGMRLETEWLEVTRVEIPVANLGSGFEGFRIALISDFHLYPDTRLEFIKTVVEEAIKLKPDLVVLTGDFVQATAEAIWDLAPELGKIDSTLGSFAVLGNHDHWKGPEVVVSGLKSAGIQVLHNDGFPLQYSGSQLFLAGVDDAWSGNPDLEAAMRKYQGDIPALLLSHEPDPADEYCKDPRICVQLSGHSHAGQVRIPFGGSPFCPPYGEKYDMGLYRVGQAWLYTNRGIGVTVPIRINCRPELTEVVLVRRDSTPVSSSFPGS
jgi:predicted MPP superfamily phosphohydrolase